MNPIGFIRTPFKFRNGTPRQSTVCSHARGSLTIEKSIFNNPEHSLEGLEEFSHIWILFIFHKNNNGCTKAKVKPPRLNGKKVGLFATRCPYRPNNIGLTLAKLESVRGATVHVSGVDILDGTPVLDIKPYIPQYDCPSQWPANDELSGYGVEEEPIHGLAKGLDCNCETNNVDEETQNHANDVILTNNHHGQMNCVLENIVSADGAVAYSEEDNCEKRCEEQFSDISSYKQQEYGSVLQTETGICTPCKTEESNTFDNLYMNKHEKHVQTKMSDTDERPDSKNISQTAEWITKPNVEQLHVRFTPTAEQQLDRFSESSEDKHYTLQFLKQSEVKKSIENILQEDPRSIYRRKNCVDNLYYFTIDCLHVTCWFDGNTAEVVRVKAAAFVEQCKSEYT